MVCVDMRGYADRSETLGLGVAQAFDFVSVLGRQSYKIPGSLARIFPQCTV